MQQIKGMKGCDSNQRGKGISRCGSGQTAGLGSAPFSTGPLSPGLKKSGRKKWYSFPEKLVTIGSKLTIESELRCRRELSGTDNREAGEGPARTRHCKKGV